MRVLVTGSAGFVGARLAYGLRRSGHSVIGIDLREPAPSTWSLHADLRAPLSLELPPFDVCFHLASDVGGFLHNAEAEGQVTNELALLDGVTQLCRRAGCRRLIYTSSIAVFETSGGFTNEPLRRLDQRTHYASAKARGEDFAQRTFAELVVVRPTNIFGPDQPRAGGRPGESHVIPDLLHKISSARRLEVLGDGLQVRNFIHVDDVVRFLIAVMRSPARGWFNLRSEIQLRIRDLAEELLRVTGQHREMVYRPDYARYEPQPIEPFDLSPSLALGWHPRVRIFAEGLRSEGPRR